MSKKKEKTEEQNPAQLFDNSIKFIMTEASKPAVVHLLNGLYKKSYPPDTVVKIEPNESIKKHPKSGNLGKIVSDIVVTLFCEGRKDTYLIEAQIDDDMEMSLRIFNYSVQVALKGKVVSDDGSYMRIEMPEPAIVYLETSKTKDFLTIEVIFPGERSVVYKVPAFKVLEHKVSEFESMALLLPFYILKIRKELEKKSTDSEKREKLAEELAGYVNEIAEVLHKSRENCYITDKDVVMLKDRLSNMHSVLYGGYEEFTEVDMTLKQMHESSSLRTIEKAEAKAEKRGISLGMEKVFALLEQGISLPEAKRRLGLL